MESGEGQNKDNFRLPDQPIRGSGGKREGSGRKRIHEDGYKSVKDLFWKNVSLRIEVYDEWVRVRELSGFKTNSDFATNLLECMKIKINSAESASPSSVVDHQSQRIDTPASTMRDFCPKVTSTPHSHRVNIRNELFPAVNETTTVQRKAMKNKSTERVFIDSIIATSFQESSGESSDENEELIESPSENENGSDCSELDEMQDLDISHDDEFLSHICDADESHPSCGVQDDMNIELNATTCQEEDMDVSITSIKDIETNIPAHCLESVEGLSPPKVLLQPKYETTFAANTEKELIVTTDKKFICSVSKLKELFQFCSVSECAMPLTEVNEKWIGCTLEIKWKCENSHRGEWVSSHTVNRIYCNNLLTAASLLFSGNNFTKLSLFSKCLNLAWMGETTYLNYQKLYIAPVVQTWWAKMQNEMFDALGDAPVSVCGDGQMDSPGHCAKICTYSFMHTSLVYILHIEVVDVRHAQMKSSVMEKVGCQRALDAVKQKLNVVEVVTDACSQIIKLLGKQKLKHFYNAKQLY